MNRFTEIRENKIKREYFLGENVIEIARDLIGRTLVSSVDGKLCKGLIVETEAYRGYDDKACHANNGRRTKRNEVMYGQGGHAYVYLCYGIHHLFNIVTNKKGKADAVLVRAMHPIEGEDMMQTRFSAPKKLLGKGPGVLTKAMGITTELSGEDLSSDRIWIESGIQNRDDLDIVTCKRVGVDYAEEDADLPWRFYLNGNEHVSRK
ncbi:MAG: DNA-3-methyladenine glycosylase [Cyclobacteriaceae bacterium]